MSPPTERGGPVCPDKPAPEISRSSRHLATDQDHGTAPAPVKMAVPCVREPQPLPEPVIVGVIELDLDAFPGWPRIPATVGVVRVRAGSTWASGEALARLACATYGRAVRVEIAGPDAATVDDAVRFVRERHDSYRLADTFDQGER